MTLKKERRKNYTIHPECALSLAEYGVKLSREAGRSVPRQEVLDTLVCLLDDAPVYKKVKKKIISCN